MMKPRARRGDLLTRVVEDELLVYDLRSHKAHCLNRTTAAVFERCDGTLGVVELAAALSATAGSAVPDSVVWIALEQLSSANLLEAPIAPPPEAIDQARRRTLRRMTLASGVAILMPAVATILAPTPAYAANCLTTDCTGAAVLGDCCGIPGDLMAKTCEDDMMGGLKCTPGACTGACKSP
jgi:hypothetical protein